MSLTDRIAQIGRDLAAAADAARANADAIPAGTDPLKVYLHWRADGLQEGADRIADLIATHDPDAEQAEVMAS